MRPKILVVDGVISSGKSTLLNVLEKAFPEKDLKVVIIQEPVDKWKESGILKRFYEDPKRWAYHFQTKAFHDRVVANISAYETYKDDVDLYILERSCFTDILFMELLYEDKIVDDVEMKDYLEWSKLWAKVMPYEPDLFLYLRPPLQLCMDRLKIRARPGEEQISLDYQTKLQNKHDQIFLKEEFDIGTKKVPIVKVNCDDIKNPTQREYIVKIIMENLRL